MKNENIFKRFINFIKNIFNKKSSQKQIAEHVENPESKLTESFVNSKDYEKEKFFYLYNSVKKGETDLSSLSSEEIYKFNSIIKEEIDLKKQKISNQKEMIKKLNTSIDSLKSEKEILEKRLENKF